MLNIFSFKHFYIIDDIKVTHDNQVLVIFGWKVLEEKHIGSTVILRWSLKSTIVVRMASPGLLRTIFAIIAIFAIFCQKNDC